MPFHHADINLLQAAPAHVPRTKVQTQALPSQTPSTFYILTTAQQTTYNQGGAPMPAPIMPVKNSSPPRNGMRQPSLQPTAGELKAGMGRGFAILPTSDPDSFVYERSEDAQSDIVTDYFSSVPSTSSSSTMTARPDGYGRKDSTLMITNGAPGDGLSSNGNARSPAGSPRSQPIVVGPQGRPLVRGEGSGGRPRSGSGDSSSSTRRGSVSDHETSQPPSRSSPPRQNGVLSRPTVPPVVQPREIPQRRLSDGSAHSPPRSRRLSNAFPPSGGSPPRERDVSPPTMRRSPSSDGKRSPEREFPTGQEYRLERRVSGTAQMATPTRERPPAQRSQYSSGSQANMMPQRERYSPQDENYPRPGFPGAAGPIRSRTLSFSKRGWLGGKVHAVIRP